MPKEEDPLKNEKMIRAMNTRHLFIAVALVAAAVLPSSAAASVPSSLTETAAFVPSALYMAEAPAAKAADAVSSAAVPAAAASSVRAAAAPAASTPVGRNGWLSVSGPRLVNEAGNPVVLTGASIGWHNLWPRFYNAGVVSTLADDWGCDVVRAAIGAELEGNYASDPETALQCLYNVVDAAVSEGIYVIVDWHAHKLRLDEAKDFFGQVVRRYKGVPNVIYEIFNEPVDDSWSDLKSYSEEVIDVIRSVEPRALVLVGTPHWDQDVHIAADDPLTGIDNVMYTLHFYAGTHGAELRVRGDYAISRGLPLFVSECAGMNADGDGPIDAAEWRKWWDWMNANGLSRVMWSVSDKNETCSMLLPSASSEGPWKDDVIKEWGDIVRESLAEDSGREEDLVHASTQTMSLVLDARKGSELKILYFGERLGDRDLTTLLKSGMQSCPAYPAYGMNTPAEAALAAVQPDGNMTLDMAVEDVAVETDGGATVTRIRLKDRVYPFAVDVCYRVWDDSQMVETWTEIVNMGKKPVVLERFASASLPVRKGDVWLSHLYGSWANEGRVACEPLTPGVKLIRNTDGVRNSHTSHAEVMISLDGRPEENVGDVIGAALCYGGNYELRFVTGDSDFHTFFAGICPDASEYSLAPKERFVTPVLALTFSREGLSGVSRNFHDWARSHRLAHGDRERKILLNSWEGVYFDITEEGMDAMMGDLASMGGELFVMDDGWFGDKYQRNRDNSTLGDWTVDTRKLPHGIDGLLEDAQKHGVGFGIWIEPEMTNTVSELYEKHPDWVIRPEGREPVTGRGGTQLVLDLGNPEVQDFIVDMVDRLMTAHPGIEYIKWDANMSIMNHGSQYLDAGKQSHLYIEYHRGLASFCERIRAKYPDLTIQACASGGGRANYGILPWFDEFWVSDNTDALQRIYMQWGTSYFFPAIAMGSHVSAAPNHQTFRTIPMKYRIDVAMSGRFGMEIQPKNMTDEEKELCRRAIADYKSIRHVVQFGDIYRLVSPYDGFNIASMMYCSKDKSEAVFYWWKLEHFRDEHLPRVKMAGLDPDRMYTVRELVRIDNEPLPFEGMSFSGKYLMSTGLEIPYTHTVDYHRQNDWSSRVLHLIAE